MALKKIQKKIPVGKTSVSEKTAGDDYSPPVESEFPLEPVTLKDAPINVGVSIGYTKNLGNYESLKVNVSLHVPCENTLEAADIAFSTSQEWVDKKMAELLETITES